jgi:CrcB protein
MVSVGLGSAFGGIARLLLSTAVQQRMATAFPLGTLVVNVTGSALLGFLLRYALATPGISPEVRVMLTTGFCGGYTTFSTYSYEAAALIEDGDYRRAALYMIGSVVLSVAGMFLGFLAARALIAMQQQG